MKQIYILLMIFIFQLLGSKIIAQSTENFEDEADGSTTFTNNGQSFTISSNSAGDVAVINEVDGAGWDGSTSDNKFIDNTPNDGNDDGFSFTISTTNGDDIVIKSFYLFISNANLTGPGTPTTITIEGKKDGINVFSINKNSGIVDGSTFTPNNGYTFIDLSTEGGSDNSNTYLDEIIITATNDADYFSLDAFTWDNMSTLSLESINTSDKSIFLYPNPSKDFIQISGLVSKINYRIYNILGSEVKNGIISNNEQIDIADFTSGLYFLKFDNGNTIEFIKE